MPTETFFNLPQEKRERITELAVDEFAAHTYHRASLSRIVDRAGIAKGSIYQYFKDKFDLYLYVLDIAVKVKLEAIEAAMKALGPDADLLDRVMAASEAGFKLAESHPRLYSLGMNILREPDRDVLTRVVAHFRPAGEDLFSAWLHQGVKTGVISDKADLAAANYTFSSVVWRLGQDLADGRTSFTEAVSLLRETVAALQNGLRPQTPRGPERTPREDGRTRGPAGARGGQGGQADHDD